MSTGEESAGTIAVIGLAGRFPGAADVTAFWRNLLDGRDCLTRFTPEDLRRAGVSAAQVEDADFVPVKGVLEDADCFDADFFGFTPREAELIDPQQRVFLEVAWAALESAGIDPANPPGSVGVFAGASLSTYLLYNLATRPDVVSSLGPYQALIGNDKDFLATRVSYKLGLRGPSLTVQTACSTSLSAVHLAVSSLLAGECDIAIAGGVCVSTPLVGGYRYVPGGILSADGACRPFDAAAGGTVAGNGAAAVVLRRLDEATEAHDDISAVILATAMNNDGGAKVGYTAPSVGGQAAVISEALAVAGISPADVGFIEAHGTGTALGDPIEVAALREVFGGPRISPCHLGAVKGNVGHLDAAAGVTSLIKAILALRHEVIPGTCHFENTNPALELTDTAFAVSGHATPWVRGDVPRRAGVSSFGIGGTNVHVVLQEAPIRVPSQPTGDPVILPLSAREPDAVLRSAARLADRLEADPSLRDVDVVATLATGRAAHDHRATVVVGTWSEAADRLRALGRDRIHKAGHQPPVAFMYPGQGAQYPGMATDLYAYDPVFRETLDACCSALAPALGLDLRSLLLAERDDASAEELLRETRLTQPALFTVEYALTRSWQELGVAPTMLIGHSVGELVAATVAGVFTVDEALHLVAERGRLIQGCPRGAMLAVFAHEASIAPQLPADVAIAARNAPEMLTLAGPAESIGEVQASLNRTSIPCRPLRTSHAFHSASLDPAADAFEAVVSTTTRAAPTLPFISNVTGTWITSDQARDPAYWGRQLRATVRFEEGLTAILAEPGALLVEMGPGEALRTFARANPASGPSRTFAGVLPKPGPGDARQSYLDGLGRVWSAGQPVRWSKLPGADGQVVSLPTYPFRTSTFWVAPGETASPATLAATRSDGDWFAAPGWRRAHLTTRGTSSWTILVGDDSRGRRLAERVVAGLRESGDQAAIVPCSALSLGGRATRPASADLAEYWQGHAVTDHVVVLTDPATLAPYGGLLDVIDVVRSMDGPRRRDPLQLHLVTVGAWDVTGAEECRPASAGVAALAAVIPHEVRGVQARVVDLPVAGPTGAAEGMGNSLTRLLRSTASERDLAVRGEHVWIRTMDDIAIDAPTDLLVRAGGCYVISGGLGGLGIAAAQELVRLEPDVTLVLLSRRPLAEHSADTRRRIEALGEHGARVACVAIDVSDADRLADLVAGLARDHGPVRGVIHCAGQPSRGLMLEKTAADIDAVMSAKVAGLVALRRACAGPDLDFLVACSSTTAVIGGPGQSDYAAANAIVAGYARQYRLEGVPACAVVWDTWRGTGMAAGLTESIHHVESTPVVGATLIDARRRVGDNTTQLLTAVSTSENWIVDEHRLQGHGLVPGTTWLELVRQGLALDHDFAALDFFDVVFLAPVLVPDGHRRTVTTDLDSGPDGVTFTVRSEDTGAGRQDHAYGRVVLREDRDPLDQLSPGPAPDFEVIDTLTTEAAIRDRLRLDQVESGQTLVFTFGDRWRTLRSVHVGHNRLLVELDLGEEFAGDLPGYQLHPALLDVAGASARMHAEDVYYLPLTYRRLRMLRPMTQRVRCDVVVHPTQSGAETLTCDMDIFDGSGVLLVQVRGFSIKRVGEVAALVTMVELAATDVDSAAAPSSDPPPQGALAALTTGLTQDQGIAIWHRLLQAPLPPAELIATGKPISELMRISGELTPESIIAEAEALALPPTTYPRPDLATAYVAPRTPDEERVAVIWQDVLGIDRIGVDDDFFALGGHSLAGVQIGAKVRSAFGVDLDLASFFGEPTVAATARAVGAARDGDETPDVIVAQRRAATGADVEQLTDDEVDAQLRELLALDEVENRA